MYVQPHINNRYIGNFMSTSFCILYAVVLTVWCEFVCMSFAAAV
jgi:hypothetical protein